MSSSYLDNLVHVFEIQQPLFGAGCRLPLTDGFFFAVRQAVDLPALRQTIIAKLDANIDQLRIPAGCTRGLLDPAAHALVAAADYNKYEQTALLSQRLNPIVFLGDGNLCLLTAHFSWRNKVMASDQQTLGLLELLRDNALLRARVPGNGSPAGTPNRRTIADERLGHAIGRRAQQPIGMITRVQDHLG